MVKIEQIFDAGKLLLQHARVLRELLIFLAVKNLLFQIFFGTTL